MTPLETGLIVFLLITWVVVIPILGMVTREIYDEKEYFKERLDEAVDELVETEASLTTTLRSVE